MAAPAAKKLRSAGWCYWIELELTRPSTSVEPGVLAGIPKGGIGAPVKLIASACISPVTAGTTSSITEP
jgi:hypothetical protein